MTTAKLSWVAVAILAFSLTAVGQDPCHPTFSGEPIFNVGDNFGTNAVADFNDDGHLDLTVGHQFLLGDGTGAFSESVDVTSPWDTIFDIKVDDFDLDGRLDAAAIGFKSDRVVFYYGKEPNADGKEFFEPPAEVPFDSSENVWHIEKGYFNEDNRPDLVAISRGAEDILLVLSTGPRTYEIDVVADPTGTPVRHMLTTGDFNGDGKADFATGANSDVTIHFGNGDGTFGSGITGLLRTDDLDDVSGHRFRAADVDGDGRDELLASGDQWVLVYDGGALDPEKSFPLKASTTLPVTGIVRFLEVADMNGDTRLDVVGLAETKTGSVFRVFLGEQGQEIEFAPGAILDTSLSGHGSVLTIGDVDANGTPDVVVTTEDTNEGRIILGAVDCGFRPGDVNGDTRVDVSDAVTILLYLFRSLELACPEAADVNSDGSETVADAILLLEYLLKAGPAPTANPEACHEG